MHIVTIDVHHQRSRVSAHCVKLPTQKHSGGMLVTVYPGGSFMGLSFETLVELGTGRHEISECDERDFHNLGNAPEYKNEFEELLAWFEEVLFGYQQGAYTSVEVLGAAGRVLRARNAQREGS